MSYFPCDIPYMSEEELIENGIKIHRTQIICNKCKHYQGVHNVQGHAPCDYWKSGSVQWNEHCSHAELYKGADVRMTVKELKEKLAEMPDEANVIVVDSLLCENQIIAIKHDEKYIDADLISRKKANDALKDDATVLGITPYDSGYTPFDAILTLHTLPPSPSRPQGQWIPCTKNGLPLSEMAYRDGKKWYGYKCSNCNFIYKGNALTESPYCKKCGADMRGAEHE